MGAWGITVRQSDDGLDLLDTIVAEQLRKEIGRASCRERV